MDNKEKCPLCGDTFENAIMVIDFPVVDLDEDGTLKGYSLVDSYICASCGLNTGLWDKVYKKTLRAYIAGVREVNFALTDMIKDVEEEVQSMESIDERQEEW